VPSPEYAIQGRAEAQLQYSDARFLLIEGAFVTSTFSRVPEKSQPLATPKLRLDLFEARLWGRKSPAV
jgi:hypothetical protein